MHEELLTWTIRLLKKAGFDNEQVLRFAEALIWSDLVGRDTHGIWRLPAYLSRLEARLVKCPCNPTLCADRQAVAVMDGDQGLGHYVGHEAMSLAIGKAGKFGMGAVGVHNSNHFGTGAYFVNLAAQNNMIGMAFSNSIAKVAAYGGSKPVFGTNPFAFGVPGRDGKHMLLDMSTSGLSGSQAMKYAEAGKSLPEGIAVDAQGNSILDAQELDRGALLPFGGAKGYGMALMVEILSSVLTGAVLSTKVKSMFSSVSGPGENGHFFLAIDLSQMVNPDVFSDHLALLFSAVRSSGNVEGNVQVPGDTRWLRKQENMKLGIPVDPITFLGLEELSLRFGISAPEPVRSDAAAELSPALAIKR